MFAAWVVTSSSRLLLQRDKREETAARSAGMHDRGPQMARDPFKRATVVNKRREDSHYMDGSDQQMPMGMLVQPD